MHFVTLRSSTKQIDRFLETLGKTEIVALCAYLNNKSDYEVPSYGSRQQLLWGLQEVDSRVLAKAIITIFDQCDDDESDDDSSDDSEEDDSEEDDSEE